MTEFSYVHGTSDVPLLGETIRGEPRENSRGLAGHGSARGPAPTHSLDVG